MRGAMRAEALGLLARKAEGGYSQAKPSFPSFTRSPSAGIAPYLAKWPRFVTDLTSCCEAVSNPGAGTA